MKRLINVLAVLAAAVLASSCLAGKYMCNYALCFNPHGTDDIERTRHKADSLCPGSTAWYDGLRAQGLLKDTTIVGYNDRNVHAIYVPAMDPAEAQGTAIVVHGYTDNHLVFLYLARMYRDALNYNVLMPDLPYHGWSDGEAAQMGWLDRLDVEKWAEVAHNIFKDDFMVLHGVSMGAATVMMASGDELPGYIRAFVEDCGYTSAWDIFDSVFKTTFPPIAFLRGPILSSASIVCNKRYGWTFKEASSVKQLAKCDKPMLFIHGDSDDFVPTDHVYKNFEAKVNGYKELWVTKDAVHAQSYAKHPQEYTQRVRDFLAKAKQL